MRVTDEFGLETYVAVFSLGEQRMFLPISGDYQDMLRRIVEYFDLELEENVVLSLQTSRINICREREVVIPESVYIHLWKHLEEVDVSIVERARVSRRRQKRRAQGKSRVISSIYPEYSSILNDLETEAALSTVFHAEAPLDEERSRTPIPADIGNGVNADSKHSDDRLEVFQGKAVRVPLEIADLRPITEPGASGKSNSGKKKKFNPVVTLFPNFFNKEIGSPETVKKEILAEPGDEESVIVRSNTSARQLEHEDDPLFEITITGPQNESAIFETRGRHTVRKVLAAACKEFNIKYEGAHLILCVSTEEGGKIQTDEFKCRTDETMSQSGVDGNAKLFVRI